MAVIGSIAAKQIAENTTKLANNAANEIGNASIKGAKTITDESFGIAIDIIRGFRSGLSGAAQKSLDIGSYTASSITDAYNRRKERKTAEQNLGDYLSKTPEERARIGMDLTARLTDLLNKSCDDFKKIIDTTFIAVKKNLYNQKFLFYKQIDCNSRIYNRERCNPSKITNFPMEVDGEILNLQNYYDLILAKIGRVRSTNKGKISGINSKEIYDKVIQSLNIDLDQSIIIEISPESKSIDFFDKCETIINTISLLRNQKAEEYKTSLTPTSNGGKAYNKPKITKRKVRRHKKTHKNNKKKRS